MNILEKLRKGRSQMSTRGTKRTEVGEGLELRAVVVVANSTSEAPAGSRRPTETHA
jgi:hypothetical protein